MWFSVSMLIRALSMNTASSAYTFYQCLPVRATLALLRWLLNRSPEKL